MAQAKTLTKQELKRLLDVTRGGSRYVEKDITMLLTTPCYYTMLLLTHWCGLRVGEVVALRISDVVDERGAARAETVTCSAHRRIHTPQPT